MAGYENDFLSPDERAASKRLDDEEARKLRLIDIEFDRDRDQADPSRWRIAGPNDSAEPRVRPHALDRGAADVYEERQHELEIADAQREIIENQRASETVSRLQQIDELQPGRWAELTPGERVAALREAGERLQEVHHNVAPGVRSDVLEDRLLGYYDPKTERITINERLVEMDHPREALRTYVHEYRHSFQDAEVRHFENEQFDVQEAPEGLIENWQVNEIDYVEDPYEEYVEQPLEYDSRSFANSVVLRMYG